VYEITFISRVQIVSVGIGLYVEIAAAAVGTLTALVDTTRPWSAMESGMTRPYFKHWWSWVLLAAAAGVLVASGIAGAREKLPFNNVNPGNVGNTPSVPHGNTGNSGNSGSSAVRIASPFTRRLYECSRR
jgi:hypothetical protein